MRKILIVGTSGSGKSSLAGQLSRYYHLPFVDLDVLFWQPGWHPTADELMRKKVDQLASSEQWVTSGNFKDFIGPLWSKADCVIWLDFPFYVIFLRLLKRSIQRAWSKEDLWYQGSGCKESFFTTFCTKDSILWWMICSFSRNKKRYSSRFYQMDSVSKPLSPRLFHIKNYKNSFTDFLEKAKNDRKN